MRRRGFTLVELMVAVACMGILGLVFDQLGTIAVAQADEELQRARAGELLRALTRAEATGSKLSTSTRTVLQRDLADAHAEPHAQGSTVTWQVRWRTPRGAETRAQLTSFAKGGVR